LCENNFQKSVGISTIELFSTDNVILYVILQRAMPLVQVHANNFDQLEERLAHVDNAHPVFILLSGAVDATTGKSWCADCVKGVRCGRESVSDAL
jgi:hypothetical protein